MADLHSRPFSILPQLAQRSCAHRRILVRSPLNPPRFNYNRSTVRARPRFSVSYERSSKASADQHESVRNTSVGRPAADPRSLRRRLSGLHQTIDKRYYRWGAAYGPVRAAILRPLAVTYFPGSVFWRENPLPANGYRFSFTMVDEIYAGPGFRTAPIRDSGLQLPRSQAARY